ncbi:uncharacterized protein LOC122688122 [Cervus elaphus]|uniref:uncharacterized protein LOC122688122 n=1 Tax=Cervus elaphus TaxID=9860 RepID=UPI001CC2FE16|nr:uncharacterized protein LOC122688122 [Cervus elaphus]
MRTAESLWYPKPTRLLEEQLTATDEEDITERILEPGVEAEEPHACRDQERLHWKTRKLVQLDRAALPQERSPRVCAPPVGNRGPARTSSHTGRWVTWQNPCFCSDLPSAPPGLQRHLQGPATGHLIGETGRGLVPATTAQAVSPWEASLFCRSQWVTAQGRHQQAQQDPQSEPRAEGRSLPKQTCDIWKSLITQMSRHKERNHG